MLKSTFLILVSFFCFANITHSSEPSLARSEATAGGGGGGGGGGGPDSITEKERVAVPSGDGKKYVFVEPSVLFKIDPVAMTLAITGKSDGFWNKAKHSKQLLTGKRPQHLYPLIAEVPAKMKTHTHTEGVKAPLLLSEWLAGNPTIEARVEAFLHSSKSPLASLTRATVGAMCDAQTFAAAHKPIEPNIQILQALKRHFPNVVLVLAGNYANPKALKFNHGELLSTVVEEKTFLSGDLKMVSPDSRFFMKLFAELPEADPKAALFIGTEEKDRPPAILKLQSLVVDPKNPESLIVGLLENGLGIKID